MVLVRNSFWNGPQSTLTGLLIKEKKGGRIHSNMNSRCMIIGCHEINDVICRKDIEGMIATLKCIDVLYRGVF